MNKNTAKYDLIQWHEGMLLAPHHFQNQDARIENLLFFHLSHLCPFFWGVKHLVIDENMLGSGRVRVSRIEGTMPDGLVFFHMISLRKHKS